MFDRTTKQCLRQFLDRIQTATVKQANSRANGNKLVEQMAAPTIWLQLKKLKYLIEMYITYLLAIIRIKLTAHGRSHTEK